MRTKYFIGDDEIIGKLFGFLTPLRRNGHSDDNHRAWLCRCSCGSEVTVAGSCLLNKRIQSCGCKIRGWKHGLSGHPLYRVRIDMIERCYNKKCANYKYYGAKGVGVCDEWKNDCKSFYDWAIQNGWKPGLSIDRYPNKTGDYGPFNCRWATRNQQDNNRTDNVVLVCRGITTTLSEFSRMSGIAIKTISSRLDRGWDTEKAIFSPTKFSWHSIQKKKIQ